MCVCVFACKCVCEETWRDGGKRGNEGGLGREESQIYFLQKHKGSKKNVCKNHGQIIFTTTMAVLLQLSLGVE